MKINFIFIIFLMFLFVPIIQIKASDLSQDLEGKILLQVEQKGEAWYVNSDDNERYYLGRPMDAFKVMRELSLGISNKDFDSFKNSAPKRLSGKIILKTEDSGKAYYIDPKDLKIYFLGSPSDAFQLMRNIGIGISDKNLNKIPKNEIFGWNIYFNKTHNYSLKYPKNWNINTKEADNIENFESSICCNVSYLKISNGKSTWELSMNFVYTGDTGVMEDFEGCRYNEPEISKCEYDVQKIGNIGNILSKEIYKTTVRHISDNKSIYVYIARKIGRVFDIKENTNMKSYGSIEYKGDNLDSDMLVLDKITKSLKFK